MSTTDPPGTTTTYEILVRAELGDDAVGDIGARCFDVGHGRTVVVVDVIDQSHLRGILDWFHDRNIEIERVNPV